MMARFPESDGLLDLMEVIQNPELRKDLERSLGDFCHQSRNRLNSLKLSLYLARRQCPKPLDPAWHDLEAEYQNLETQFQRIETTCRPIRPALISLSMNLLFEDRKEQWSAIWSKRDQSLGFDSPTTPCVARFDVAMLGAALDSLVEWRAEQGTPGSMARVGWWVASGQANLAWIEPSTSEADGSSAPTGAHQVNWSLPILSRVIAEHTGSWQLDTAQGWSLHLTWPA